MQPSLKILVIEDDLKLLSQISINLTNSIDNFERKDIDIQILESKTVKEGIDYVHSDGDIQAVVLSWDVVAKYEEIGNLDQKDEQITNNALIIDAIKFIRPELPVYILADDSKGLDIINESKEIESFFYRDDIINDPESILGYIINDFDDRSQTPFWSAYRKYVAESNDSWHTPGHSGGSSFRNSPYINDFYQFYGRNVFASDLSMSVDSLGSLSDSTNVIGRAQEAAAYTFEVKKTYFVTNGSSTSNKIILQTLLRTGDKVIIDRNCHKSVHYGIIQAAAHPIYLSSVLDSNYGFFAPPSLTQIKQMIEENQDAKLLVLTGCSYEGLLIDLKQVVDLAHSKGIKVFIDEAWFAYSLFHPRFRPYSAIHCGADYVAHSAHKVVSAFSQASYIHVNDPDFDQDFFREIFNIYTSTSPKYQIIASLDVCHKQLEMEGYKILNSLLGHVDELKRQVKNFKKINILDSDDFGKIFSHFNEDNMGHDPLKILIDFSNCEYSTLDIHKYLNDEIGLEIEKYTQNTILVLLTLGGTRSKVIRLYNALKKLEEGKANISKKKSKPKSFYQIPPIELKMLPSDAFFGRRESIDMSKSENRISAGLVTPYPPGIPLLVPGQLIKKDHINFLKSLIANKIVIQGLFEDELYVLEE